MWGCNSFLAYKFVSQFQVQIYSAYNDIKSTKCEKLWNQKGAGVKCCAQVGFPQTVTEWERTKKNSKSPHLADSLKEKTNK